MRAYKANMIPGGVTPTINVSQYDNDYAVTVTLIEGAEIYTPPAGATIRVEGTKPDGHGFEYACTYQGNVVTMPIYTQMTVVSGRFPIELVVYQNGLRVGSCNIIFAVEKAPLGEDTDISETVIPDIIAGAQAQADAAQSSADAAQSSADAAQEAAAEVLSSQIVTEASGSIATFSDGANDVAVKSLVAEITPVQSGSGDPSPTNIRPIIGRTGLTVTRENKNLAPNMAGQASTTSNGITFTYNDDGSVTLNGTATSNVFSRAVEGLNYKIYLPHGTYKKPVMQIDASHVVGLFVQYVQMASAWTTVTGGGFSSTTFTIDEDYPIVIRFAVQNGTTVNNVRFEPYVYPESVSDLTWVSPVKREYPVTWESIAGTVYGGTLDVVSGVLTVDKIIRQCDADSNFAKGGLTSIHEYYLRNDVSGDETGISGTWYDAGHIICSHAANYSELSTTGIGTRLSGGQARIYFPLSSDLNTLALFKTWLGEQATAGTPLQFCYKLATPQTYQLTPTEVRTILGGNTIYTDAGDVSVGYIADTKLYIDNKIAELQALVLEN